MRHDFFSARQRGARGPAFNDALTQATVYAGNRLADVKALNITPTVTGVTTQVDTDGTPIGFSIAAGQAGHSASILSYPLANKATIAALAGKTIRIIGRFFATTNFLALKPLDAVFVDVNRYVGTTAGGLVYEGQTGNVLTRIVEYTVVGNESFIGLIAQVSLAAGTTGTAMTLRLESISYNVVGEAAATIDAAVASKAAGRFGASLIRESQPAIGTLTSTAQFTRDPVTNFINGYQVPAGVNSFNSNFSWYWLLAPEDFAILRGARVRLTIMLDTSLNFSRSLNVVVASVNRDTGGGAMADQNIMSVRKYANRQVYVIEGVVFTGTEQIVASIIDQTNAVSAGAEYVSISDVQIEIVRASDGAVEPTQATMMLQRNITARVRRALPVERVTVATDGSGDYYTLRDALANATSNQVIQARTGTYNPTTAPICFPAFENAKLRGIGAERPRVNFSQAQSTAPASIAANSTSDFHLSCEVENIHFIAANARYASHPDAGGIYYNQKLRFADCIFEHSGNETARAYQVGLGNSADIVWRSTYAVGLGAGSGAEFEYDRCSMLGFGAAAFYAHSWGPAQEPHRIRIRSSMLDPRYRAGGTRQYSFYYENLGSEQRDTIELIGNILAGPIACGAGSWRQTDPAKIPANKMTFSVTGYGNSPAAYVLEDDGSRALRITSATTGTTSSVVASGTAATALLGTLLTTVNSGHVGYAGNLYGWLDVGDHAVGANGDQYVTQMGRRLGDCTSASKVMTVTIDGGAPITITFNQNHTNQSNATILALINAALGAAGAADLFNVNELFRPRFSDEETRVFNSSSSTILRKCAVARWPNIDHPNARTMTNADPASLFVGIAYEDIRPGQWGRVKTAGHVRAAMDMARSESSAFVAQNMFGVANANGQFAKGAAIPLLTAISASDVRFGV